MSQYGCVRFLGVLVAVLLVVGGIAVGDSLVLRLDASGGLNAKLLGLAFSATLEGDGVVDGTASCEGGEVCLSATSVVMGVGVYDILNLETKGWVLASAAGVTSAGQLFGIQSVAYVSRQDETPLQIGDLFEGVHHTKVTIGASSQTYQGSFSGTITGGLSTNGPDGLLQLVGSGCFTLIGESVPADCNTEIPPSICLDDPDLSADFLLAIERAFLQ